MKIALFGAGSVGSHLSRLLADAQDEVVVCLRPGSTRNTSLQTATFAEGAAKASVVVVAVPFTAAIGLLSPLTELLKGKIVIDCTNPLNDDWSPLLLGQEYSAGEAIANSLPGVHVVKAFNTIFADVMPADRHDRGGQKITAFVAGDHSESTSVVCSLAESIGFASIDVGPLRIARQLEALAHLNIQIAVRQGGGTNSAFIYHQVKG